MGLKHVRSRNTPNDHVEGASNATPVLYMLWVYQGFTCNTRPLIYSFVSYQCIVDVLDAIPYLSKMLKLCLNILLDNRSFFFNSNNN